MDRDIILKHSKSIRLYNRLLSDFTEVLANFCEKKGFPQHLTGLIQCINAPLIGQQCIQFILEEYEKEFNIIKLVNLNNNQIIDIW